MVKATVARGAVIERSLVKRWIGRQLKQKNGKAYDCALLDMRDWLDAQPKRTARKGGIGR